MRYIAVDGVPLEGRVRLLRRQQVGRAADARETHRALQSSDEAGEAVSAAALAVPAEVAARLFARCEALVATADTQHTQQ